MAIGRKCHAGHVIRFLLRLAINLVVSAVALVVAAAIFEGVTVHATGFIVAVAVFALAQALLAPVIVNLAQQYASAVLGGVGLISTLIALWIATLLPGGLEISGVANWIGATVIVWLVSVLGSWILGALVVERWWDRRADERQRIAAAEAVAKRGEK